MNTPSSGAPDQVFEPERAPGAPSIGCVSPSVALVVGLVLGGTVALTIVLGSRRNFDGPAVDPQVVTLPDGTVEQVPSATGVPPAGDERPRADHAGQGSLPDGPAVRVPFGRVVGARSGDKGGDATLGVYARSDDGYRWLASFLTTDRLRELLPETADLALDREVLPGLRAVLFQVRGLLGDGVAAATRFDPQAKALGEWLRARTVDVPASLLPEGAR